jgi:acrylyl-CoA reductase (NADPH)
LELQAELDGVGRLEEPIVRELTAESELDNVTGLGAAEIMPRSEYTEPGRPLARERWAGVVDVVGSNVLANACAATRYNGVVTACGLAGGMDFNATVAPFILRGVTLAGVESVMCPFEKRMEAWTRLAADLDIGKLQTIAQEIALSDTLSQAEQLLAGSVRGRTIVDVSR